MATKALVTGQINKNNSVEIVLSKRCENLREIQDAMEDAFDRGAGTVIVKRIKPSRKR